MLRVSFGLWLGLVLMSVGCGYGSRNYMTGNGMPNVKQLMPSTATAGGAAFVLMVSGTGFGADSVVYWGTTTRTTIYVSTTLVTADINMTDIANAGTVEVYVHSGGVNSNSVAFTIQ